MKELHQSTTIGIADEHAIMAAGLIHLLRAELDLSIDVQWIVSSGRSLMEQLRKNPVRLLISELKLAEIDGLDLIEQIKSTYPHTRILILSQYDQQKFVKMAFSSGVDGYVLKRSQPKNLIQAVRQVIQGEVYMGEDVHFGPKRKKTLEESARKKEFEKEDRFKTQNNLTDREREILIKLAEGQSVREIAQELFISDQTVSAHKRNMMRKFDVHSSRELVEKSRKHKLL
jgi:DNA-binding NarL/FixJ family response regulator